MKTSLTVGSLVLSSALLLALAPRPARSAPQAPAAMLAPDPAGLAEGSEGMVAWGDADGDGRRDALVVDAQGSAVLLLHRGAAGLQADSTLLPLVASGPLAWAGWQDVDRNGTQDLLLLERSGALRLLRNDPGLGFLDVTADVGLQLEGVRSVQWLDVDGNGSPDLVTSADDGLRLHTNREGRFETQRFAGPQASGPLVSGPLSTTPTEKLAPGGGSERPGTSGPSGPSGPSGETSIGPWERSQPGNDRQTLTVTPTGGTSPVAEAGPAISCAQTLRDGTTGMCLEAASSPSLGRLYPMSTLLNVSSSDGYVGINTNKPTAQLSVIPSGSADAGHFQGPISVGAYLANAFRPRGELGLDGTDGGTLSLRLPDETPTVDLRASEFGGDGAALRLSNLLGVETIRLDADTISDASAMVLSRSNGATSIWLEAEDSGTPGSQLSMYSSTTTPTIRLTSEEGVGNGAQLDLALADGTQTIVLDAEVGSAAAEISLYERNGVETFEVVSQEGASQGSQLRMATNTGVTTVLIDAQTTEAAEFSLFDRNGVETVEIRSEEVTGTGSQIVLRKADGTASIVLDAEQGATGRITTDTLEITGGADLVESFHTGDEVCEPGSVVVIDPTSAGELMLSSTPYDRRVAGIVSGAGNVRPGLHMGQTGVASGDTPVALTGRVFVKACDENGPIRPGDLLTTSSRPGHAMRATDPAASFGATLGKAMGSLEGESGLVLVLVGLQ